MNECILFFLLFGLTSLAGNDENIPADKSIIVDSLKYLDYNLERLMSITDYGDTIYTMVLKYQTEVIQRFKKAGPNRENWNEWKLVDLIKGGNKELQIMQYSGGAHCCEYNWIYEFYPHSKEIFSSLDYRSLGFMGEPLDINGDGNYELVFQSLTFDYFYRCCHAASPGYNIIFEYDSKQKRYVVQNIKFKEFILRDLPDTIEISSEFKDIKPSDDPEEIDPGGFYLGAILGVVVKYLYAGEDQKAWDIFDKYYILNDKDKIKELIIEYLEEDEYYQKK